MVSEQSLSGSVALVSGAKVNSFHFHFHSGLASLILLSLSLIPLRLFLSFRLLMLTLSVVTFYPSLHVEIPFLKRKKKIICLPICYLFGWKLGKNPDRFRLHVNAADYHIYLVYQCTELYVFQDIVDSMFVAFLWVAEMFFFSFSSAVQGFDDSRCTKVGWKVQWVGLVTGDLAAHCNFCVTIFYLSAQIGS